MMPNLASIAPGRHWLSRALLCWVGAGLVLLLSPLLASAMDIIATSDRDPVSLQESFTLIFSADEEPDSEPDFSPLYQNFEVLRQGKSTQVNMVNGQFSRRTEWKLTALAKRAGTLTVPQILFGGDQSKPFTLTVLPGRAPDSGASGDEPLMLEVEAEPKNPYVQAQVLFTIRLLHRIALRNGQLDDPKLIDAVVQKLGEDRRYQTERNGHLYGVIERRFAIFPQKSGALRIEPIGFEAELSGGPGSMFDQFFGHQGRIRKIQSDPVELQVRPIPASFKGKQWLPAAKLALDESWSTLPPETKVGEPITRTLSVHAEGVTMGMVPELADRSVAAVPELKRYPDQPALSEEQGPRGLTSIRREKAAFIPMKDGDYRIPGTEIPWWNTSTDHMEIARIPERLLKALPAPPSTVPEPNPPAVQPVHPDEPAAAASPAPALYTVSERVGQVDLWFWLTWAFAFGWLSTGVAWWWKSHNTKAGTTSATTAQPSDLSKPMKSLRCAAAAQDPAAARRALLDWGLARWPKNPPANLEQIAARLGGVAPQQIAELNRALYGQASGAWLGEEIYRLIADASTAGKRFSPAVEPAAGLEGLYKS